jgi:GT2 family glycosyltransferase
MNNIRDLSLSIVIPTLGGNCLEKTLKYINKSTIKPNEILLCIPKEFNNKVTHLQKDNVYIIETEFKGQVSQRALGFKLAKSEFVMQLDDDILVDENCFINLINDIKENSYSSCGPSYYDIHSHEYKSFILDSHFLSNNKLFSLINFNSFIIKEGRISKGGLNFGLKENTFLKNVEWLPGGCILHRKKNLVLCNYYKFNGKAYLEDVFHSKILKNNGIDLLRSNNAIVYMDKNTKTTFLNLLIEFPIVLMIRIKFCRIYSYSLIRMFISIFFLYLDLFINYLKKKHFEY